MINKEEENIAILKCQQGEIAGLEVWEPGSIWSCWLVWRDHARSNLLHRSQPDSRCNHNYTQQALVKNIKR
jgi:hypothetical protein